MRWKATILGTLCAFLAFGFGAIEVYGVAEYFRDTGAGLTYVAVASCGIAGVSPFLPGVADFFRRARMHTYRVGAWVSFAVCLVIVIMAAIQRTGSAVDAAQQAREQAERAMGLAEQAVTETEIATQHAERAALEECKPQPNGKSGRRGLCMDAEAKAEKLRGELRAARGALRVAPTKQTDSLAARLAVILPIDEERIRQLQPLLVPIALSFLSSLFFSVWAKLDFPEVEKPALGPDVELPRFPAIPAPKPKKMAAPGPTSRPPQAPNIVPIQRKAVFGSIKKFAAAEVRQADGERLEVRALLEQYRLWCKSGGLSAADLERFLDEIEQLYEIEPEGDKVYVLNVRLAA